MRQLEYLLALAETLHFGRAAARCSVSQPALSQQIRELEEGLGVTLFERSGRRVLATAAGERVAAEARKALEQIDAVVTQARGQAEPLSGPLRLGVIPTVAPYWLPLSLPGLRAAYPSLALSLREDTTQRLLGELRRGALDAALLALPVDDGEEIESLALLEDPFVLATAKGHPLAARARRRVGEECLAGQRVILLEEGHCLRAHALKVCDRVGARSPESIQATSLATLVQMVAGGLGVTLLPSLALRVELQRDPALVAIGFRPPAPSRTLGLVFRRSAARRPEMALLGRELLAPFRARAERGAVAVPRPLA